MVMRLTAVGLVSLAVACLGAGSGLAYTVCDVQQYDPSTGYSPFKDQTVTLTGIVTVPSGVFLTDRTSIYMKDLGSEGCGINVYSAPSSAVQGILFGDTLTVTGQIQEYVSGAGNGATTEIVFTAATNVSRVPGPRPDPEIMDTGAVGREANEGKFVRVTGRLVGAVLSRSFVIDDGTGELEIFDLGENFTADPVWTGLQFGDEVTVTGVVTQSDGDAPYLSGYSLSPRLPELGDVVTPQCIPGGAPAAMVRLSKALFNPADGEKVRITYNGPDGVRLRLRVFDAYGRCAADLDDEISLCGERDLLWDGRNEIREQLPVGLYHVVVTATDPKSGAATQQVLPLVIGRRLE
ncbi:MAG: hypothetical protein WAW06_01255 [bacterium]